MAGRDRYRDTLNKGNPRTDLDQPMVYEIRVRGHLGDEWTDWFGGLTITLEDNGDTLLTGQVADQAALHGLLRKVRDMGMPLISATRVKPSSRRSRPTPNKGLGEENDDEKRKSG
jgi:hypothetical protein